MNKRDLIERELELVEVALKELQIRYEQYFAGVEKREPQGDRQKLTQRLRRLGVHHITQTDLRFRYQNLGLRFHSYAGHWDRILRLMEEGRFHRSTAAPVQSTPVAPDPVAPSPLDRLYEQLLEARRSCSIEGPIISRERFAAMISEQREKIRSKFGDREVDFQVVTEDGKPKIKVKSKGRGSDVPGQQ